MFLTADILKIDLRFTAICFHLFILFSFQFFFWVLLKKYGKMARPNRRAFFVINSIRKFA